MKTINEMFKTAGEAYSYCKENGIEISMAHDQLFEIAYAIYKAKVNQDKITRHACIDEISNLCTCGNNTWDGLKIYLSDAINAIKNTKAI